MQLNIQNVTPETVEVQGQVVARAYAEGVMLATLIATAGTNKPAQEVIVSQYMDAGLSVAAFPAIVRSVETRKFVAERETAERLKEAREHAERFKSYEITPLDEARRRAKREDRERKYQDMGRAIRSANGRSDFSSGNWLDNNN
ncbi:MULTISPECIES: hypothetical protein [Pseudomonas]|jgi:hypothetical protein|uniref:hypothetical protein n=1 Tax=Pseudomonas TaxID=286 RepID=UPI0006F856FC|nr:MULTISPECIES: hypothetical protein [Pseudomonas]KRC93620.1 hypothetical protein ASE33_29045 [Pseudomonas sp. Root9]MDH0796857.1 hypothetical protein [Pseudomonas carnis]MDO3688116.1 hypothetical protein [Pseudomonas sp. DKN 2791]MDO7029749.1 hypothetical protein [Pseudomonas sp. DKN 2792]MDW8840046.1 hypothetical protein [Pseudomonas carnis]